MLFGLTNTPATFQAYINKVLSGLVDTYVVVYLNDILIYSSSKEEHVHHICEVLEQLWQHALYINLKKCKFFANEVDFLGFIVGRDSIWMDPEKVESVASWPP